MSDGGPAFPTEEFVGGFMDTRYRAGMSMRDYFAAKVIGGICADVNLDAWDTEVLASKAYEMADAMLKAREGK
jgi:hypothetical protein